MKTLKQISFLKRGKQVLLGVALLASLASCKKNNDTTPSKNGKSAKFTFTVTGATQNDYVSFVVVGATATDITKVWKLNGVTQTSQQAISLGKNDFLGATKTYVVESGEPLNSATVGIQCLAAGNNSYKVSYKAEIDGKVINNDDNVTVTSTADYSKPQLAY